MTRNYKTCLNYINIKVNFLKCPKRKLKYIESEINMKAELNKIDGSDMSNTQATKISMNKIEADVREIIYQRANPLDEMMSYIRRLSEGRYTAAEMNKIEADVREIIYQRADPFDEMMSYMRKLLNA